MGKLASRGGSYLITIGLVAFMLTVTEQQVFVLSAGQDWLLNGIAALAAPITTTLTLPVGVPDLEQYFLPLFLTLLYAVVLFGISAGLFRRKDLLWAE